MNTGWVDDLIEENHENQENIRILAEALRDLYNDVGEIPEVKEAFEKVYCIVKEYA